LPCRHTIAVHIVCGNVVSADCIGTHWAIADRQKNKCDVGQIENRDSLVGDTHPPTTDQNIYETHVSQQSSAKGAAGLLKDLGTICNRVGYVQINGGLVHSVDQLGSGYPLAKQTPRRDREVPSARKQAYF